MVLCAAARAVVSDDADRGRPAVRDARARRGAGAAVVAVGARRGAAAHGVQAWHRAARQRRTALADQLGRDPPDDRAERSEEHTSKLQSLMRISYAVFCLKKK